MSDAPETEGTTPVRVFFISRAGNDRELGKAMAGWLRAAGYEVFIQDWSVEPGSDFLEKIDDALTRGAHVLALLSDDYLKSRWCKMEWNAAVKSQVDTGRCRLTPLRIRECKPDGLMGPVVFEDLVGLSEEPARHRVLTLAASAGMRPVTAGEWAIPAPADRPRIDNLEAFDASLFAGREDELDLLHQAMTLETQGRVAVTALSGLGGVGKSALARAYCDKRGADYEVVWWIRSERESDLESDLAELARRWNPANASLSKAEQAREALQAGSTWAGKRPFLLVFDNVANPSVLRAYRPGGACRVIVTSRNTSWGREWRPITVRKLDPDTGAKLMLRASGRDDYEGARKLAVELDGLALPLSHAAAILRENVATTFADLSRRYDEFMEFETDDADVRTTYATYSVAIQHLAEKTPFSQLVMSAAAYCSPEAIPASIIAGTLKQRADSALVDQGADAMDRITDAFGALARYALIEVERPAGAEPNVSVHRVVQRVVRKQHSDSAEATAWGCATLRALQRDAANDDETRRHAKEALTLISEDACPDVYGALSRALVGESPPAEPYPGLQAFVSMPSARDEELDRIHLLLNERSATSLLLSGPPGSGKSSLVRIYAERYRRDYAEIWIINWTTPEGVMRDLVRAARGEQASFSAHIERDVNTALAYAARQRGRGRVLVIIDEFRVAGESVELLNKLLEHRDLRFMIVSREDEERLRVDARYRLGPAPGADTLDLPRERILERFIDNLPEASRWMLDTLALCAPSEIPEKLVARIIGEGAVVQNPYPALRGALEALVAESVIERGEDQVGRYFVLHTAVIANARQNLSAEKAVEHANRILEAFQDVFPSIDDPDDWPAAQRLAVHGEAVAQAFPQARPELILGASLLVGRLQNRLGDVGAAIVTLERAYDDTSGATATPAHVALLNELTLAHLRLGQLSEAERYARAAVQSSSAIWGAESRETAVALQLSATAALHQGREGEARPLVEKSLEVLSRFEAPNSSNTIAALEILADCHIRASRYDLATKLVWEINDRAKEGGHPAMLAANMRRATKLALARGDLEEAERTSRESVDMLRQTLGESHPNTAQALSDLASVLEREGRFDATQTERRRAEAESLRRHALATFQFNLSSDAPAVAAELEKLGRNLVTRKRHDEAMSFLNRAFAIYQSGRTPEHLNGRRSIAELIRETERARPLTTRGSKEQARRDAQMWVVFAAVVAVIAVGIALAYFTNN